MAGKVFIAMRLACSPQIAFDTFINDIDLWWKQGPRNRFLGNRPGVMQFADQGNGKTLLCQINSRRADIRFDIGQVITRKPAERLIFEWQWPDAPNEPSTRVDIRFAAIGGNAENASDHNGDRADDGNDDAQSTRLTLDHQGLERLSMAHPARNGLNDNRFKPMIAHFWQAHLISLRNRIDTLHRPAETGITPPQ